MKSSPIRLVAAFCCLLVSACAGDADEDDGSEHSHEDSGGAGSSDVEGLRQCCELGAICHAAGEKVDPKARECHDLAHSNDPDSCREIYDDCLIACIGVNDDPVEHSCE